MLSCKEVTHLLSQAQERPLELRERVSLRMHLLVCEGCVNFRRQLDFLQAATRRYLGREDSDAK